jgi:cytochrome c
MAAFVAGRAPVLPRNRVHKVGPTLALALAPRRWAALMLALVLSWPVLVFAQGNGDPPGATGSTGQDAAGPAGLSGKQAFLACAGCHSLEAGAPHGVGPNLHDLAGRRAGSAEGYAYSPALRAADLAWDRGTLTAWIVQAESVVPGTWMLYHNHLEPGEVTRLVDYLLAPR